MNHTTPVRFLRVTTINEPTPDRDNLVLALASGELVKFSRRDGWTCQQHGRPEHGCHHVDAVIALLDDRVMGGR